MFQCFACDITSGIVFIVIIIVTTTTTTSTPNTTIDIVVGVIIAIAIDVDDGARSSKNYFICCLMEDSFLLSTPDNHLTS